MPNSKRARPEITRLATRRSGSTDISDIYGGYTQAGAAPSPAKQAALEAKVFSFPSPVFGGGGTNIQTSGMGGLLTPWNAPDSGSRIAGVRVETSHDGQRRLPRRRA